MVLILTLKSEEKNTATGSWRTGSKYKITSIKNVGRQAVVSIYTERCMPIRLDLRKSANSMSLVLLHCQETTQDFHLHG